MPKNREKLRLTGRNDSPGYTCDSFCIKIEAHTHRYLQKSSKFRICFSGALGKHLQITPLALRQDILEREFVRILLVLLLRFLHIHSHPGKPPATERRKAVKKRAEIASDVWFKPDEWRVTRPSQKAASSHTTPFNLNHYAEFTLEDVLAQWLYLMSRRCTLDCCSPFQGFTRRFSPPNAEARYFLSARSHGTPPAKTATVLPSRGYVISSPSFVRTELVHEPTFSVTQKNVILKLEAHRIYPPSVKLSAARILPPLDPQSPVSSLR
ncbi:hypothetical protein CC1G_14286 [Coprinopsis cinerea okayama7|uniref:Uncharacterized protein n=1 Tax=Coprinopsis cinerea (strain Okayama-7 / 130 / ATCC MYA-4618 / FGSC 9003) TaxID=240176 RepID=D6RLG8_COPC7|nr:hypothetical protein CC1G_14286 [Coprinopsis cinerea okayama7\|eukprot:XP_002911756.1 hypothetical protein CC1G_14286 [Coprinopsis cinerea okayama7\